MSIGATAKVLGVSITTLRRWEADGKLTAEHTAGGHRRYDLAKLRPELFHAEEAAIAYARVSSHDQKTSRTPETGARTLLRPSGLDVRGHRGA